MAQPTVRVASRNLGRVSHYLSILGRWNNSLPTASILGCDHCVFKSSSSSPPSSGKKILSLSTLLLQDGLDIQELPLIVRRTDKSMFPFTSHMYAGEEIRPATEEDETFKHLLQRCSSVEEVFKLLEIPSEKVTGYSASYALLRMCRLKDANRDWDDLDSFICTAVMNELYDTVRKEISSLANETIQSLVKCYLSSANFSQQCAESVNEEIERRIADAQFSIQELCVLGETLQSSSKGDKELVNHIWVHIGNRYKEICDANIKDVCQCLPSSHKYIMRMVEKQSQSFWWKMHGQDISMVLTCMVRLNSFHGSLLQNFGKWVFTNVHDVQETDLMQIVTGFIHFNFSDGNLIRGLERYVPAKGSKIDTNLLALVLEYFRGRRYLSPRILDAAAMHFTDCWQQYSPLQTYSVLRPFGQLNYLPQKSTTFLLRVENVLSEQFSSFDVVQIVELLCSFAFVGKIPTNFVNWVLTPSFLSKVKAIPDSNQRIHVSLMLEMFQSAIMLEMRRIRVPHIFKLESGSQRWLDEQHKIIKKQILGTLEDMVGRDKVLQSCYAHNTVYPIDFELCLDEHGNILTVPQRSQCHTRLALLVQMPYHYCVNSRHLLGEYVIRNRHLRILEYKVIELLHEDLSKLTSPSQRRKYLQAKLEPYIKVKQASEH